MTAIDFGTPHRICFGRRAEREEFIRWIENEPAEGDVGRAALMIGPAGMGKSTLLLNLAKVCRDHEPEHWYVQLEELNANESPSSFLARLLEKTHRLMKWRSLPEGPNDKKIQEGLLKGASGLLTLIPGLQLVGLAGSALGHLLTGLVRDDKRPGWQRFIDYAKGVSNALAKTNDRFILLIDPDRAMQEGQADEWLSIAKKLPPRIRILIAQRPDDVIAVNAEAKLRFAMVPSSGSLPELGEDSVDRIYKHEFLYGRLKDLAAAWPADACAKLPAEAWKRYRGHPFAHDALIRLLISRTATDPIQEMAKWPPTLEALLDMLLKSLSKQGEERMTAALALQVFAIPTPLGVWAKAAGLADTNLSHALHDPCYAHFFMETEQDVFTPFHALFAERLEQELQRLSDTRHTLAEAAWKAIEPDLDPETLATTIPSQFALLAATRAASRLDSEARFFGAANRVSEVRLRLGMLDDIEADCLWIIERYGPTSSRLVGSSVGNLGVIAMIRGEFSDAEKLFRNGLHLSRAHNDPEGEAINLANLATLMLELKDDERAEEYCRMALEIDERHGRTEGIACCAGTLAMIFRRRGDLDKALAMNEKALAMCKEHGGCRLVTAYTNQAIVLHQLNDLPGAVAMLAEAAELSTSIGWHEGTAGIWAHLGILRVKLNDSVGARTAWAKSRDHYRQAGMPHMVAKLQRWLDDLDENQPGQG